MREFVFFFLYGMLALTGMFLLPFWSKLMRRRVSSLPANALRMDRYFWLTVAFTLVAIGSIEMFGARAIGNATNGLSSHLYGVEGFFIGKGAATILLGMAVMVWLADLERRKPRWLWGMGAVALAWTAVCLWLVNR